MHARGCTQHPKKKKPKDCVSIRLIARRVGVILRALSKGLLLGPSRGAAAPEHN